MAPTSRPRRGEAPASAADVAPARGRRAMSPAARSAKSPPPAVRASKPRGKTAAPAPAAPAQPLCPPHITLHRWAKRHKYDENGAWLGAGAPLFRVVSVAARTALPALCWPCTRCLTHPVQAVPSTPGGRSSATRWCTAWASPSCTGQRLCWWRPPPSGWATCVRAPRVPCSHFYCAPVHVCRGGTRLVWQHAPPGLTAFSTCCSPRAAHRRKGAAHARGAVRVQHGLMRACPPTSASVLPRLSSWPTTAEAVSFPPLRLSQATFTASAVYNIVGCGAKWFTQPLRRVDHACIYLMIAVRTIHCTARSA